MRKPAASVLILFFSLWLGTVRPVLAAQFTAVDDSVAADAADAVPGDAVCETAAGNGICTLRAAIMEANALAGPDEIAVPAGTYTLTLAGGAISENAGAFGDLDIASDLSIIGAGAATTTVDGNASDRVFHVLSGTVSLSGVTVTNGRTFIPLAGFPPPEVGAGIFISGGTVSLSGLIITDNHTGSGVSLGSGPFSGGSGGGLAVLGGSVTLSQSTVSANTTGNGAAGTTFLGPNPGGNGGDGGGVFISGGDVTLDQVTLRGNATGIGGIGASGNASSSGASGGPGGFGGGIFAFGGTVALHNVTLAGNTTGEGGPGGDSGGTFSSGSGGNGGSGAGIAATGITVVTLNNVTITGNSTGDGGLFGTGIPPGTAGAAGSGGGIYLTASLELGNSIIAGNTVANSSGLGPDCSGTVTSNGFNLIGDGDGCVGPADGVNGDDVGPAGNPINPLFDPAGLNDNGGLTQTIAIQAASPAKDTGDNATCEAVDQRGEARPVGGPTVCDKGAFEITTCGDGATQTSEGCDDGNTSDGDGCSATCAVETGFSCAGTPSVCALTCGNGAMDGGEICDDGNNTAGDGCNAACAVESGFTCTGFPSDCDPTVPGGSGGSGGGGGCSFGTASASPFVGWPALLLVLAGFFLHRRKN